MIDVILINPNTATKSYQDLSKRFSAIEPPTWSLLLAASCRSIGQNVEILDANAENLTNENVYSIIKIKKPRFICFVVYGQNVNSGTTSMAGSIELSNFLKSKNKNFVIGFIGSHMQALPLETINKEESIDIVFTNEGVYALRNLLELNNFSEDNLLKIKGIYFRSKNKIHMNLYLHVYSTHK